MVVETATEQLEESQAQFEQTELEIDQVRAQLADYQQALDAQQTLHCNINKQLPRLKKRKPYVV